ncbi:MULTISPECIES: FMN-binding protein [unclassified Streptomyces]|uniref:FMN-binding protein n=1 Tax=unclassified Streptomyces TaxID=2593676 RepID=UPI002E79722F|nr:FMN-binding protein [Streptomyces sp. JV176]MEE1803519.1 FMN-binding protein [Streptomyces sp. JV176]
MSAPVRRAVLAAASTSAVVVLLLSLKPHHTAVPAGGGAPPPAGTSQPQAAAPSRDAASPAQGGSHPAGGTYTGDAVSTPYGTVQVSATVRNGRLTAVKVLRVPSGDGRSQQLAGYAVPQLTQEALGAHSAHIDAVSGASYTSQGYIQSLQSALDQAGV